MCHWQGTLAVSSSDSSQRCTRMGQRSVRVTLLHEHPSQGIVGLPQHLVCLHQRLFLDLVTQNRRSETVFSELKYGQICILLCSNATPTVLS